MKYLISLLLFFSLSVHAAPAPHLAFSDLVSGPNVGLGDGLGEGAIVTVWGYRLGDSAGSVTLIDTQGKAHPACIEPLSMKKKEKGMGLVEFGGNI